MNLLTIALALAPALAHNVAASTPTQDSTVNDTVMVGGAGTRLLLELHGRADAGAPIILYLHGGPGSAFGIVAFRTCGGPLLEQVALVAYLHQRGVLGSPAVLPSQQTIANHVKDVLFTMDYLSRRYPGRPIFLLGHSWGGLLATDVALEQPPHLAGVILASAPFDMDSGVRDSYDASLAWARQANNADAIAALTTLGPPPYTTLDQQIALSRWASTGNGGIDAHMDEHVMLGRAPYLAFDESWGKTEIEIAGAMLTELYHARTSDRVSAIHVPLLDIDGARDLIVPERSLHPGYDNWGGPRTLIVLADSHHLPFVDEPARFADVVRQFVLGQPVR